MNELRIPLRLQTIGRGLNGPHETNEDAIGRAHNKFHSMLNKLLAVLIATYGWRPPFVCTAPIDLTAGLKSTTTTFGPVRIVSLVGSHGQIEIREEEI